VEFGAGGLTDVLAQSAAQPAEDIIHAVVDATRAHAGTDHYTDDFTIVVAKRTD
jgi:serine phosphatase RsbU (regulator of sigma subunit)